MKMLDKPELSDLVKSFLKKIGVSENSTKKDKQKLIIASTEAILKSDYGVCTGIASSKFLRNGEETVKGIIQGKGGMCGEKAEALRTILNYFNIDCRIAAAGEGRGILPKNEMREILKNHPGDSENQRIYKYFRHVANIVVLDGKKYLVDPTFKEIPIFSKYSPQRFYKIKFFEREEGYFYRELPQDIYNLILADIRANIELWAIIGATFALLADYSRMHLVKLILATAPIEETLSKLARLYTDVNYKIVLAVLLEEVEKFKNANVQTEFNHFFCNWLNQNKIEEFKFACCQLNRIVNQHKERLTQVLQIEDAGLLFPLLIFVKKR